MLISGRVSRTFACAPGQQLTPSWRRPPPSASALAQVSPIACWFAARYGERRVSPASRHRRSLIGRQVRCAFYFFIFFLYTYFEVQL